MHCEAKGGVAGCSPGRHDKKKKKKKKTKRRDNKT